MNKPNVKTNHGAVINRRVKENYGDLPNKHVKGILHLLNAEERAWVEKYERLEYAIERGFAPEAVALAKELNPNITEQAIDRIKHDRNVKERCNPLKAEIWVKRRAAEKTTDRAPNNGTYDTLDWLRSGGTTKDEDDEETEKGITLNPEEALVDALDAAKAKGIDLETYLTDSKYWTQPTEAHRPEKISDTQVEMIRALQYVKTRAEIAKQFGISIVMVSLIWNNKVRVLERK